MKTVFLTTQLFFASLIVSMGLSAQSTVNFAQVQPTSPTASSLQKFADYPVSLNTGLVDVSIPVYQINISNINVPIELKYHAAGIKYDDACTGLGLGWTLFAGGMVTRSIVGIEDGPNQINYFKNASDINPLPNCNPGFPGNPPAGENSTLMAFDRGNGDSEYDIYNFNFLNEQGRFFYPGTTTPIITPHKNMVITRDNSFGAFTITGEDGVMYKFGYYDSGGNAIVRSSMAPSLCDYLLTEIISTDKADTVTFNYNYIGDGDAGLGAGSKLVITDQITIRDNLHFNGFGPSGGTLDPRWEYSGYHILENFGFSQVASIKFRTGHVAFNYDSNKILTGINVYNTTSPTPVKSVTLQQSSYGTDDQYKLDQVNFYDNLQAKSYNYQLQYNGVPYNRISGIDYWGFHNGATLTNDFVPQFQAPIDGGTTMTVGSMDRTPNETAMLQGTLKKITYPTGGSSIFNFEAHRYSGGQLAGGLRIKKIDNYDISGSYLYSKWYKYGLNENGDGTIYRPIFAADYTYTTLDVYTEGVFDNGPCEDCYPSLPPYFYTEHNYGAFPKFSYFWSGSAVVYDYVTEYTGDGTNSNGKTIYSYENIADVMNEQTFTSYLPLITYSNAWKTGELLQKNVYSKTSSTYNLIYSLTNQYQDFNVQNYHNLKIISYLNWHDQGMTHENMLNGLECYNAPNNSLSTLHLGSVHSYADYYLTTGLRAVTTTVEMKDGVTDTTQFSYDPTYLKPIQTISGKSTGDHIVTTFNYPFSLTTAPYPAMVTNNIIAPVITKSNYKNDLSHFLESTTTNYADWGHNLYAPQSLTTQTTGYTPEQRILFGAYDTWGNLLQQQKPGGLCLAYQWGYTGQYPVASVANAKNNFNPTAGTGVCDIFYDSFEEGDGTPATLGDAHTGHYSHTGSYSKTLSHLDPGNYILSYWSQASSGSPWLLTTTTVMVNGSSYTIGLSAQIDDVRFYPSTAQMTTYTYDPLIGMTSSTDVKDMTTYYEYDSFGRLSNVKDMKGNIVKHIDYHYQSQAQ